MARKNMLSDFFVVTLWKNTLSRFVILQYLWQKHNVTWIYNSLVDEMGAEKRRHFTQCRTGI